MLGQRGPVGLSPISAYVVAGDNCSGQAVLLFPLLGRGGGQRPVTGRLQNGAIPGTT